MQDLENMEIFWEKVITSGVDLGKRMLAAIIIFVVGHYLIRLVEWLLNRSMNRKTFDPEVRSFLASAVSIGLNLLLVIAIIGALGIETTSFAALLTSAGVAIGMALSGQMQNLAGGILILLQRPYHIGDYIISGTAEGVVTGIHIFNTILLTTDNKEITIPNGSITSSVLINVTSQDKRRIDLEYSVEYNTDIDLVRQILMDIATADEQVLDNPAPPKIMLSKLADSSVDVKLRIWVPTASYWDVLFRINEAVYKTFNEKGIGFPFPQLTVHQAK